MEMKPEPTIMTKVKPKLKQLVLVGLILGSIFAQWNGEKCLIRGEKLFEDKWAVKSLLSSVIIEIVFILLTLRLEDSRNITENSEGLTICVVLHLLSGALSKYYDAIPLKERGTDLSPSLMPIILLLCCVICKTSVLKINTVILSVLLMFGSFCVTMGLSEEFTMKKIDYLSFAAIFLTVLKLLCLKQFQDQNIKVHLRSNAMIFCFIITLMCGPVLEFLDMSDLGAFLLVSTTSGIFSIFLLYLLYNYVLPKMAIYEITMLLMISCLCHQMLQSDHFNFLSVLFGLCILIGCYGWRLRQHQTEDTKTPFKDLTVTRNELFTRIEFTLFLAGVVATFLYILPPRVSKRDMDNLSYVGLDKIVRKLLHIKKR